VRAYKVPRFLTDGEERREDADGITRRSRRQRRSWPGCEKSTDVPGPLRLLYLDECKVHCHPRLAEVWQRRGRPLRVPAAGEDGKFVVFGALDYASGQIVWQLSPSKDGTTCVAFPDHLVATFPEAPLVVVLDNVGYHKGRLAKDWWLAHHDRVRPLWLPAYAPALNLLERVWGYVKDKLSCHRWWADQAALEAATAHLLSRLQARFQQPDSGCIALVHNFCEAA
jgi:transposase